MRPKLVIGGCIAILAIALGLDMAFNWEPVQPPLPCFAQSHGHCLRRSDEDLPSSLNEGGYEDNREVILDPNGIPVLVNPNAEISNTEYMAIATMGAQYPTLKREIKADLADNKISISEANKLWAEAARIDNAISKTENAQVHTAIVDTIKDRVSKP